MQWNKTRKESKNTPNSLVFIPRGREKSRRLLNCCNIVNCLRLVMHWNDDETNWMANSNNEDHDYKKEKRQTFDSTLPVECILCFAIKLWFRSTLLVHKLQVSTVVDFRGNSYNNIIAHRIWVFSVVNIFKVSRSTGDMCERAKKGNDKKYQKVVIGVKNKRRTTKWSSGAKKYHTSQHLPSEAYLITEVREIHVLKWENEEEALFKMSSNEIIIFLLHFHCWYFSRRLLKLQLC